MRSLPESQLSAPVQERRLTPDEAEAIGRELCDLAGGRGAEMLCSLGLLVLGVVTGVVVGWAVWAQ
jgi:hypothetical protein